MRWKKYLQNILTLTFIGIFFLVLGLGILRYKKQQISDAIKPINTATKTNNVASNTTASNSTTANSSQPSNNTTAQAPTNTVTNSATTKPTKTSFDGAVYETPFGPVGVSITVSNKKIVEVSTPTYPDSPPSIYAQSELVAQALAANSSNIQGVSGATYTSLAFSRSLESAISKAGSSL